MERQRDDAIKKNLEGVKCDDPMRMQMLREKFIAGCKKQLGVPYARKFWKEDEPLQKAPLFLDCCALIRQVLYDLKEDLGFVPGKGNQCQQFDTLPLKLEEKEMRPGDLVFQTATYYNPKAKPQKHNMVHVEVYLGPTEQTIGSRWQRGVIQVFDSYKFVSKLQYDIDFHYRSIDTWLMGICKSHCAEHPWLEKPRWAAKGSIFDEEDTQAAYEEDVEEAECTHSSRKVVFMGSGNNFDMVKSFLESEGWDVQEPAFKSSNKYTLNYKQTRGEIDFRSFKPGEQLVNHIGNVHELTTKSGLTRIVDTIRGFHVSREYFVDDVQKDPSSGLHAMFSRLPPVDTWWPKTWQTSVVADAHEILSIAPEENACFIDKPERLNQGKGIHVIFDVEYIKEKYWGNHLLKDIFFNYVDSLEKAHEQKDDEANMEDEDCDKDKKMKVDKRFMSIRGKCKQHEQKPKVIQRQLSDPMLLETRKFDMRQQVLIASVDPLVVLFKDGYARLSLEEYTMDHPHSNPEVLPWENEEAAWTENKTYTDWWQDRGRFVHLTNASVQKKHSLFKTHKEDTIKDCQQLAAVFEERGLDYAAYRRTVMGVCEAVVVCASHKLQRKKGSFELLGFDFMVDTLGNPWLIEANTNPALFTDTQVQTDVIPPMAHESLQIVFGSHPQIMGDQYQTIINDIRSNKSWNNWTLL